MLRISFDFIWFPLVLTIEKRWGREVLGDGGRCVLQLSVKLGSLGKQGAGCRKAR